MLLFTIQHKKVLEQLRSGRYCASYERVAMNLEASYKFMQEFYGWDFCPVFACIHGTHCNFYGAGIDDGEYVILKLNVPDEYVKIQRYYEWTDFVYYMGFPEDFKGDYGCKTVEEFGEHILNGYKVDDIFVFQAAIPYIEPDWVEANYKIEIEFLDLYVGNGGVNILKHE